MSVHSLQPLEVRRKFLGSQQSGTESQVGLPALLPTPSSVCVWEAGVGGGGESASLPGAISLFMLNFF